MLKLKDRIALNKSSISFHVYMLITLLLVVISIINICIPKKYGDLVTVYN